MGKCASAKLRDRLPQLPLCKVCLVNPVNVGPYSMRNSVPCGEHCRRLFLGIGYKPIRLILEQRMAHKQGERYTRQKERINPEPLIYVSRDEYQIIWNALRRYKGTAMEDIARPIWLAALGYCRLVIAREVGMTLLEIDEIIRRCRKAGVDVVLNGEYYVEGVKHGDETDARKL